MNGSIRFFQALYFCIIHLNLKDFIETEFGMSLKFGTSGLRGLSVDLKGKASAVYATAFARHLLTSGQAKAGDPILVARDFRDSSPDVSATCIAALKNAGLTPLDCGTVPTPALALYGLSLKAGALMITGAYSGRSQRHQILSPGRRNRQAG